MLSLHRRRLTSALSTLQSFYRSTHAPNVKAENQDYFRCSKSHPEEHKIDDIGLFYTIPSELASDTLFQHGGWRQLFIEQCKTFRESCVMIREPGLEIIHYIKNTDFSSPVNKYLLYGKKGSGKSMTLSYIIHYAYLCGWLLVHVPHVEQWCLRPKQAVHSERRPGFLELNTEAVNWLLHFRTQNYKLLTEQNLTLMNDYKWNMTQVSRQGDSLLSLVDYGLSNQINASEVIISLLDEIKHLSKAGRIKALVCIDGFNLFFLPKSNIKITGTYKPPTSVSFFNSFINLTKSDWHNGAAVLSCDGVPPDYAVEQRRGFKGVIFHTESVLPRHQLGPKGFEGLFPFIPIEVPNFSREEAINMLNYFRERRWLLRTEGDEELLALSGCNGWDLMKLCAHL